MGNTRATVVGDAERLQQVTWNLLTNAVKFTPAGGAVEIAVVESGSTIRLSVRDTGEGFTAEFKNLMFDAFSQGDASFSRPHGGLGLGLTIVRRLVEAHGGTVDADSPGVGQGATFIVTLPAAPADDLRQPLGRLPATAPVTLAGLSILVVDDEADSCELMAIVLHGSGAAVVTAGSARAALDLLERGRFDVVLADIGMPHEDGFWLIREIRRLPSAAHDTIPVIAVTAFASASDRQAVLDSGFDAHVPKPVDADNLTAAVDRARNRTPQ